MAPLLPADPVWTVTLPAVPAAGGAMDDLHVYIPLQSTIPIADDDGGGLPGSAAIVALDRETGTTRWTTLLDSTIPPLASGERVFVAAPGGLYALSPHTGLPEWRVPLPSPVQGQMLLRGHLLVAQTEHHGLVAVRVDRREVAWQRAVAADTPVLMTADSRAVYVAAGNRLASVLLADGSEVWSRELRGTLSEPAVGRDRVFVGSDANAFWALNPRSGREEWSWDYRYIGGDVIGAAVDDDVVYVASLDNVIRALNRRNGNQRWREEAGRPVFPPRAFFGTVVAIGLSPTISTFVGASGTPVSTWSAPSDAELQGPPLIDEHLKPFRVALAVITRDGVVTALRPRAMMFAEPAPASVRTLPGRPLPLERLSPELEYLLQRLPPPVPPLGDPVTGSLTILPGTPLDLERQPEVAPRPGP